MRWRPVPKHYPSAGDYREVNVFLWLPKTINDEARWLERARIRQFYFENFEGDLEWFDLEWMS